MQCVSAHDVGRAINPLNCVQQVEGAVSQGIGYALMEELMVQDGKVQNPNFRDYKVPTALDHALMATTILLEAPHARGPYGAKGLGEPAVAPTAAAIGNAIYDAIGIRLTDLPITAEKVLKAIHAKR